MRTHLVVLSALLLGCSTDVSVHRAPDTQEPVPTEPTPQTEPVAPCRYELTPVIEDLRQAASLDGWQQMTPIGVSNGTLYLRDGASANDEPRLWHLVAWSETDDVELERWSFNEMSPRAMFPSWAGMPTVIADAMSSEHRGGIFELTDGEKTLLFDKPYSGLDIDTSHPTTILDWSMALRVVDSELGAAGRPGWLADDGTLAVLDFPTKLFYPTLESHLGLDPVNGPVPCDNPHCAAPLDHFQLRRFDVASGAITIVADDICRSENPGEEQGDTLPEIRSMRGLGSYSGGFIISDGLAIVHIGHDGSRRVLAAVGSRIITASMHDGAVLFTTNDGTLARLFEVSVEGGAVRALYQLEVEPGARGVEVLTASTSYVYLVDEWRGPTLRLPR